MGETDDAVPNGPFWLRKSLAEMTPDEWESLCDGCGRCCLHKIEDAEGEVRFTAVACRLLDLEMIRCSDYAHRSERVKECLQLKSESSESFAALPNSCAYRRLDEGRPLADWHPLVSGDPDSVRRAGISMRGRVVAEAEVDLEDLERYAFED
jgi:uncharacterized cysteine cluster protein YcgN (CxxCxxCC family)